MVRGAAATFAVYTRRGDVDILGESAPPAVSGACGKLFSPPHAKRRALSDLGTTCWGGVWELGGSGRDWKEN